MTQARTMSSRRFHHRLLLLNFAVLAVFLCLGMRPVFAGVYYVDYANGSDGNSGLSKTSPFKHCPGDKNATGIVTGVLLKGGDVVTFKGGVQYKGMINAVWGGSDSARIVYDGNSTGAWGTGRAILNGNMTYDRGFEIVNVDNITIRHFEVTNQAQGRGIGIDSASNITVEDTYIHRIFDWDTRLNTNPMGSYIQSVGSGIRIDGSAYNILIDRCDITRTGGQGIGIKGESKKITIRNSKIHEYINWFIDIGPSEGKTISDIFIHNNDLYDMFHYSSDYWNGTIRDEKVHYSSTNSNPHQDGIFVRNPLNGTLANIRIYNNNFFNDEVLSGNGGTAQIYTSETRSGDSIFIYNNTFQNPYPYTSVSVGWLRQGKIYIYNNTFHLEKGSAVQVSLFADWGTPSAEVHLKNNIFNIPGGGTALKLFVKREATIESLYSVISSDYNVFAIQKFVAAGDVGYLTNLSDWQSNSGHDLHSKQVTEIGFASPRSAPYCSKSNLNLTAGSPAIDAGTTVGSDFAISQNNQSRPYGSRWDAGAFEYNGTIITGLAAPTGLKITGPVFEN